jgi:hypothetical protein
MRLHEIKRKTSPLANERFYTASVKITTTAPINNPLRKGKTIVFAVNNNVINGAKINVVSVSEENLEAELYIEGNVPVYAFSRQDAIDKIMVSSINVYGVWLLGKCWETSVNVLDVWEE